MGDTSRKKLNAFIKHEQMEKLEIPRTYFEVPCTLTLSYER